MSTYTDGKKWWYRATEKKCSECDDRCECYVDMEDDDAEPICSFCLVNYHDASAEEVTP
jgi:hypothetical protein